MNSRPPTYQVGALPLSYPGADSIIPKNVYVVMEVGLYAKLCPAGVGGMKVCQEPGKGFEPSTFALQKRCSTVELSRHAMLGQTLFTSLDETCLSLHVV